MENACRTKHGSLLTALSSQYSLGNDQYPDQLEEATNVLSNHKFDQLHYDSKSKKAAKEKAEKDRQRELARNREEEESPQLSFAQTENQYYCCGKKGHTSPKCPKKDSTPKAEWVINKTPALQGVQHLQQVHAQTQAAAAASVAPTQATAPAGSRATVPPVVQPPTESMDVHSWVSMPQVSMAQIGDHMKDRMLLDSCSSVDLFCNPNLVRNTTKTEKTLNLACNVGLLKTDQQAEVPVV